MTEQLKRDYNKMVFQLKQKTFYQLLIETSTIH